MYVICSAYVIVNKLGGCLCPLVGVVVPHGLPQTVHVCPSRWKTYWSISNQDIGLMAMSRKLCNTASSGPWVI